MTRERTCAILCSAPFALWLAMLMAFPATPAWYAVRTAAVAILGIACLAAARTRVRDEGSSNIAANDPSSIAAEGDRLQSNANPGKALPAAILAIVLGLAVFLLWIFPERFPWYAQHLVLRAADADASGVASPCETAPGWLLAVKVFGSAFVIAPVEEIFFRSFLYRRLQSPRWLDVPTSRFDLSAFAWMVGLFALEHDRPVVAAVAGACYGFACLRGGVGCAIAAHVLTNLLLGVYVCMRHAWQFW